VQKKRREGGRGLDLRESPIGGETEKEKCECADLEGILGENRDDIPLLVKQEGVRQGKKKGSRRGLKKEFRGLKRRKLLRQVTVNNTLRTL